MFCDFAKTNEAQDTSNATNETIFFINPHTPICKFYTQKNKKQSDKRE